VPARGLFVSVEGIEASGKSTLLGGLAAWLQARGRAVVVTREPGGTPLGEAVRALFLEPGRRVCAEAEALLMNAARAQHVADVIEPALAEGAWVLCDRFATATLAYQGYGRGLELETLQNIARFATAGVEPDVVLLVDVPAEVSHERVVARAAASGQGEDRLELENAAFHTRVRDGYLALAREDARIRVLDGTRPPQALLADAARILGAAALAT
jgi:dTMP kinase